MIGKGSAGPLLVLSILFSTACSVQTKFEINVAMLPQWNAMISHIREAKHQRGFHINYHTLSLGNIKSDFDKMEKAAEYLRDHDIHVVIGQFDELISFATEFLNVTYLSTTEVTSEQLHSTFQIVPKLDDFSQAFLDMVKKYNWDRVSIFFDDNKGMSIAEKLLTDPLLLIKAWRLDETSNEKQVREHLIRMRRASMQRSIVICRKQNVKILVEKAFSLAMLSTPYEWVFYDPGDELVDVLNAFPEIRLSFTVFTLKPLNTNCLQDPLTSISFDRILAEDAVALVQEVVSKPFKKNTASFVRDKLVKRLSSTVFNGKSGTIQFDGNGKRNNLSIILKEASGHSTKKIGEWYSRVGMSGLRLQTGECLSSKNSSHAFPLTGRVVRVVTIMEKPFCMYKRDHRVRLGNDRFEGFAIDLIREVGALLNFKYELYLVHDGKFGGKKYDESWDGLIGELLGGNATMSVAPLSINSEREAVVDFTNPFMTRHLSVLMKISRPDTSFFEFLKPFHPIVWFCTLGGIFVMSFVLYILERFGANNKTGQSSMTFKQSCWLVFGSLLRGNTNTFPSTIAGKVLTSFWWIFVLVLLTSYTANLTAFLTVRNIETSIKTVADLTTQSKVKFGTVHSSGIVSFFKATDLEPYATVWEQMSKFEEVAMVSSSEYGFKKVKEESYAFFWDSTVNKYMTTENCDLVEIGTPFDPKGFGIGVPTGATYKDELSLAILKLSDNGRLQELENRWWGVRNCPDHDQPPTDETSKLHIDKVAGVFIILFGGVIAAATVCLGEFFVKQISLRIKMRRAEGSLVAMETIQTKSDTRKAEDQIEVPRSP